MATDRVLLFRLAAGGGGRIVRCAEKVCRA
jgi:hypothetical protein